MTTQEFQDHPECECGCCGPVATIERDPVDQPTPGDALACRCDCGCGGAEGCSCGCADANCGCGCGGIAREPAGASAS